MEYEIVNLLELVLSCQNPARLTNSDPSVGQKIGQAWQNFMPNFGAIPNKVTGKPVAIYSNYESDETGAYDYSLGCEVGKFAKFADFKEIRIPAQKYAKFVVSGDVSKAVPGFWQDLWRMDLPRNFGYDFEEYQSSDLRNSLVFVYISVK